MCIPHATGAKTATYVKKEKERVKRVIKPVSQDEFEHGDPDFVDERTKPYAKKKKTSWIEFLLG